MLRIACPNKETGPLYSAPLRSQARFDALRGTGAWRNFAVF